MSEHHNATDRARSLRRSETKTEKLLWSLLRGKQVCGLKFRRQHPIGPFFADFACVSHKLVVELDGGYHDSVAEADLSRQATIENEGWSVIRFSDQEVQQAPEAVAIGIAKHLGLTYEYRKRAGTGSGMKSIRAPNHRQNGSRTDTLPAGGSDAQAAGEGGDE